MGHTFHPTVLREYDVRGVVGETVAAADFEAIGRAFATLVARDGGESLAVGYDGRLSSPDLEAALVKGIKAAGLDVVRVGLGPTPMLYYAACECQVGGKKVDGGIMITGSHNPPDFNGAKFVKAGKPFFGEDIQALGRLAEAGDFASGRGGESVQDVADAYVARLLKDLKPGREMSVAWDPGNGAAGAIVERLTAKLPGRHVVINSEIDGTFPAHHPDPTVEKNLDQLKALVAKEGCDLGIGFDGDGDRIGVIDGAGRVLWGDQLLVLLAEDVLETSPGAQIIADVKSSRVFFDEVARLGGKPVMWRTGHSHIKAKMIETGAPLAGEMSAHIFFKDKYYGFDDALYAAIRLLGFLGNADKSLAEIRDALPSLISTPEIRFDCPDERKFGAIEEVRARLAADPSLNVFDLDGVRVESEAGWWLLRASNTQPVLVARCEGRTEADLAQLKAALETHLSAIGLALPDA